MIHETESTGHVQEDSVVTSVNLDLISLKLQRNRSKITNLISLKLQWSRSYLPRQQWADRRWRMLSPCIGNGADFSR
ncbi:putative thiol peroxidase [Gossypium arboreum]|uniref:Putative thiol peroxidase n=1 Tax=Gossypium arboreum TaxID=29729 RepID=A0A0B0N458_GOSAR|nr:putative thiol peroxidase [Gossypium arboreum]